MDAGAQLAPGEPYGEFGVGVVEFRQKIELRGGGEGEVNSSISHPFHFPLDPRSLQLQL